MREQVKSRRYDNTRREARVRATRALVADAARRLFLEHGYPATTVEAIGLAADVPLATVYRLFGSKRGILTAVLDVSFVGDDQPVPLHDRSLAQASIAESDPRRMLAGFARLCREVLDRSGDLQQVLRGAAAVDPEAAEVLEAVRLQRLDGQRRVARALSASHALAGELSEAEAADIIYTLMSPEVHRILTVERGWDSGRYERWLTRSLCTQLLSPGHGEHVRS